MSNKKQKRKSTTKHKKIDISRFYPIIAIVEVLVLIGVSTYAWYFFSSNKDLSSGVITVDADSGLEIDFKDADKTTFIDVFDYVDENNFYFEPATSVDGRNIYFPTSGTFNKTDTASMVFRDGTINDINSKYINVDFELTNTTNADMEVYLSHNSFFRIKEEDSDAVVNGKALRLALYNNDGNSGRVSSNIISNINKNIAAQQEQQEQEQPKNNDEYTIYFKNTEGWEKVNAFVFDKYGEETRSGYGTQYAYTDDNGTKHYLKVSDGSYVDTTDLNDASIIANPSPAYHSWPGAACFENNPDLFSFSFDNPLKSIDFTSTVNGKEVTNTYYSIDSNNRKAEHLYDSIIFNNGSSAEQTIDITEDSVNGLISGTCYTPSTKSDGKWEVDPSTIEMKTVYFLKPDDWGEPYCKIGTSSLSGKDGGTKMTAINDAIYSFTFPQDYSHILFYSGSNGSNDKSIGTGTGGNNKIYSFLAGGGSGVVYDIDYSASSIYFYNDQGWEHPYAVVNAYPENGAYKNNIAMIKLSQNLYYCPLASPFLKDVVAKCSESYASGKADNCWVYFTDGKDGAARTEQVSTYSEHVYRVLDEKDGNNYFRLDDEDYSEEIETTKDSYAVISPGVSAGFQRSANPVNKIDYANGKVESIVPTFASSFDDYLIGSKNPVFKISSGKTVNMSMIIWLEGTDEHCTAANYAGNNINLYLEFSTFQAGDTVDNTFTYRFIDQTREHWTSDTKTDSATGVTVSPVMQLYDATVDRGYLMEPKTYTDFVTYNHYTGDDVHNKKVLTWECLAPQDLTSNNHVLEFRRVNPYDESQVWDRWQAGNLTTYRQWAMETPTRSVNFTAFANGSPDPANYSGGFTLNGDTYSVPERSCGGLWGRHETEKITVYDGRKSRNIGSNNGCLNFSYRYHYDSNTYVDLETKASDVEGYRYNKTKYDNHTGFYEIIVPSTIYDQADRCSFRNYQNLNDGDAIDSARNKNITLEHVWTAPDRDKTKGDVVGGPFFEIDDIDGNTETHCYWGSDVVYIQISNKVSDSFNDDDGFNQVKFFNEYNQNDYSFVYNNDFFVTSGIKRAFVAVVPTGYKNNSDQEVFYTRYQLQRADKYNHSAFFRYSGFTDGDADHFERISNSASTLTYDRIFVRVRNADYRVLKVEYDYVYVYYDSSDWTKQSQYNGYGYYKPYVHLWEGDTDKGTHENTLQDTDMYNDYGVKIFRMKLQSNYGFEFVANKYEDDKYSVPKNAWESNGVLYYPNGWDTSYDPHRFSLGTGSKDKNIWDDTSTHWQHISNEYWPQYRPKDIRVIS